MVEQRTNTTRVAGSTPAPERAHNPLNRASGITKGRRGATVYFSRIASSLFHLEGPDGTLDQERGRHERCFAACGSIQCGEQAKVIDAVAKQSAGKATGTADARDRETGSAAYLWQRYDRLPKDLP